MRCHGAVPSCAMPRLTPKHPPVSPWQKKEHEKSLRALKEREAAQHKESQLEAKGRRVHDAVRGQRAVQFELQLKQLTKDKEAEEKKREEERQRERAKADMADKVGLWRFARWLQSG